MLHKLVAETQRLGPPHLKCFNTRPTRLTGEIGTYLDDSSSQTDRSLHSLNIYRKSRPPSKAKKPFRRSRSCKSNIRHLLPRHTQDVGTPLRCLRIYGAVHRRELKKPWFERYASVPWAAYGSKHTLVAHRVQVAANKYYPIRRVPSQRKCPPTLCISF